MPERVALVTGASRGIGRACAVTLARHGHRVAINYRERADDAKETLRLIEEAGSEGICVAGDVTDAGAVGRMFDEVHSSMGPVSILINNAGIRRDGLGLTMSDDAWRDVMAANLDGAFTCSRVALKDMLRARWGRIVNVGSVAGLRGSAGQANYAAAKAGLIGLSKTLAREVAARGITVNVIAPGLVETEMTTSLDERRWDQMVKEIPARRAGRPEEIGDLAGYLCSESAGYVNGAVFVIDGGMAA
jgi:3-oxoacyl-[acyl-carrier protein] reductase